MPWWQERIAAATVFVATPAGDTAGPCDVIGFVELAPGELRALYVEPAHWGTGVADALHDRAARWLGTATLLVMRDNLRARRFYERHGWALDGNAEPVDFDGTLVPFVRYRR